MAKRIKWTPKAQRERQAILEYWAWRNGTRSIAGNWPINFGRLLA